MSSLMRWDPFRELEELQSRFFGKRTNFEGESVWAPAVDISEDEKSYHFKAELPEVRREDIKIKIENGVLTLSGERKHETEQKGKRFHRIERNYGSFLRSFSLPDQVDTTRVAADFSHGVLNIEVPKTESAKPKLVEIKVN